MSVKPAPIIVTVLPEILATAGFELEKLNLAVLLLIGSIKLKKVSPKVFVKSVNPDIVGIALPIVKINEVVPNS